MDHLWERSIPFYKTEINEIAELFQQYDKNILVLDFLPINIGCRNSNYKIQTNQGPYLLRICTPNDTNYRKEKLISELLSSKIHIPRLLYMSELRSANRTALIYEYISGSPMIEILIHKTKFEDAIIMQVAESAAHIHNHNIPDNRIFDNDYPPFMTWYDLFLEKEIVTERIGPEIKNRIKKLIAEKQTCLQEIDQYISLVHSDFRPANMIVDRNNAVWIVDWEFAGYGHSIADIGQFFRYSNCFDRTQIKLFEDTYNSLANRILPTNWYELCKLRDLINLLQMLGESENYPLKYSDLRDVILDTLEYLGY
jgi:thiamine kinase-like enzyme